MATTPKLTITKLEEGQGNGEVTVNEALNKLDAIVQLHVKDRDLTAPPGSPAEGDAHLVATGGTGEWSGKDGKIAAYFSGWVYFTPGEGWRLWVDDENLFLVHNGTSWAQIIPPAAETGTRGGVLKAAADADTGDLTDNSGGTSGSGTIGACDVAITDPADSPADADALREDLVTNVIPDIEAALGDARDAVATLAAYCNTLKADLNDLKAKMRTAGQLAT